MRELLRRDLAGPARPVPARTAGHPAGLYMALCDPDEGMPARVTPRRRLAALTALVVVLLGMPLLWAMVGPEMPMGVAKASASDGGEDGGDDHGDDDHGDGNRGPGGDRNDTLGGDNPTSVGARHTRGTTAGDDSDHATSVGANHTRGTTAGDKVNGNTRGGDNPTSVGNRHTRGTTAGDDSDHATTAGNNQTHGNSTGGDSPTSVGDHHTAGTTQ
jgi:hypothetical protein